ncbi:VWA domain-containing protein [Telmatocola sphagniphila]|uniref:VWA domain-containing protein n=1 Tax=Telmatocola sphagniphila TaxID=1123043 RepID=A0A8E6B208_9BACT|nr:VWA domain-containing protein [Telmatocola sphagniphila]QVL30630.1 VWA domain-containing protein [Telmatocola sphagniphila]
MRFFTFHRPDSLRSTLTTVLPMLLAITLMIIALAGPRWGIDDSPGIIRGRDLVLILDLSKSMEAADMNNPQRPQRWQAGRDAIFNLLEDLKSRGGHRVALIVFAAKPLLVCPLTVDYNHLLQRASEISLSAPPTGIYPNDDEPWTSGTRIGSAVRLAVDSHDPRFEGYQDVILISDGDDPSPDRDSEIETGIIAASRQHIPVHCVGVGDSKEGGQIIVEEVPVQTKLEEAPLRTIARLTDGIYFSAGRDLPPLDKFFRDKIEPRPSRELPEELLPQAKDRRIWFVLPAIALLCLAWRRE